MDSPTDIATLFANDPLGHSNKDIDTIIAKLREGRLTFKTDQASPKPKAAPKSKEPAKKVSLDELF